jgi:WD40 repeat protein/uncharacterized caspase-like protein
MSISLRAFHATLVTLLMLLCVGRAHAQSEFKAEIVPTVPHAQIIGALAFDHDGSHLVSGDWNGLVKIWDTRTRQLLRTYEKNLDDVNALAFSPSGKEIVIGDKYTGNFKLIDAASGREILRFQGSESAILSVAFSPDGKLLASGHEKNGAKIWDVASGRLLFDLVGHSGGVYSVAFTPDGKQLLTASFDKSIRVWDVATGKVIRSLTGASAWQFLKNFTGSGPDRDEDVFRSIAISPDGKWAVSGSWGHVRNVKLWDMAAGKLVRVFEGQSESVMTVAFSTDGRHVFAAGDYGKVVMWDAATGEIAHVFAPHVELMPLHAMAVSPDGKVFATGVGQHDWEAGPDLWDISSGLSSGGFGTSLRQGLDLALTPDGRRLVAAADDGAAVWDAVAGRLIRTFGNHEKEVGAVAISRDGKLVLTGAGDNLVKLWDVTSGALIKTFRGHDNSVERVALSPDAKLAASGSSIDGIIKVWDLDSGVELATLRRHVASIRALDFSADGRSLVSGSWDGSVIVWDLVTGAVRFDLNWENRRLFNPQREDSSQSSRAISWAGFSADGERILALTHSGVLSAWDAHSGAELMNKPAIANYVPHWAVSHDGKYIFWGGGIGSITMTDADTGQKVKELPEEDRAGGHAIATSGDDRRLASIGSDRTIRIWDTASGALLLSLFNGANDEWIALTPQGFFNASSPKAGSLLSVVRGLEATSIGQTWQSLFAPDLVRESLAGDPDGEVKRAGEVINLDKVVNSGPAPLAEITSRAPDSKSDVDLVTVTARITDRGRGVGRIEWRVNGVTTAVTGAPTGTGPSYEMKQTLALDPGENAIEVVAYNARNLLASLPAQTTIIYAGPADAAKPKLYLLAIGIDTYHDKGWTPPGSTRPQYFPPLSLAVGDAKMVAEAFKSAGEGLYGEVRVRTALDAEATGAGLDRIVRDIAAEINPRDTFILFAAAHGYSNNGRFYLIPQDYQGGTDPEALMRRAISQERLQDWIANRITAKKALILLDTCESGALTDGYSHSRTDAPASEAAIGRLHEATGRPVLTAAAEGKPAFEGFHGHGVFTWSLIDALFHGDTNGDGLIELSELSAHVESTVPKISAEMNGRGAAEVIAELVTEPHQTAHFGYMGGDFPVARRLQ